MERIKQGDIFRVKLDGALGSEQIGYGRPCLIVQNDIGNEHSKTTIVVPFTKKIKNKLPTHYLLDKRCNSFLSHDSIVLCEQIRCIDTKRLDRKIGKINKKDLDNILEILNNNF